MNFGVWDGQSYVSQPVVTVQQGVFLAPSDVEGTFEDNVAAVPGLGECVQRIVIDPSARNEILQKLYRMGISAASLYPGLEGFARSLRTKSLVLRGLPTQHAELLEDV